VSSEALYRSLLGRLVRPAVDRVFDPACPRWRRELETLQWQDPELIRDLQLRLVKTIVEHAYAQAPHYRETFDNAGLHPRDLTPDTFARVPILERRTIREKFPLDITARGVDLTRIRPVRTSGTTSEPVRIYPDPRVAALSRATFHWLNEMAGIAITDRRLHLDFAPGSPNWLHRVRYLAGRARRVSADPVLDRDGPAIASVLNRWRPQLITSYPSLLRLAALALRRGGLSLDFTPTAICYQSESMDQETYDLVRATFGAPVYARYGIREVASFLAQSCPVAGGGKPGNRPHAAGPSPGQNAGPGPGQNLHINALAAFVEVVDADGRPLPPGQEGRLLVTDLWNRVTPLIRYDSGDIASLDAEPCSCGRGLPLLKTLAGRKAEYLVLPSGRILPATALYPPLLPEMDRLWAYQWVHLEERRIEILVVPVGPDFGPKDTSSLESSVREFLGEPMDVKVRIVSEIPRERSGKRPQLRVAPALASMPRSGEAENAPEDIAPEGGSRLGAEEDPEDPE